MRLLTASYACEIIIYAFALAYRSVILTDRELILELVIRITLFCFSFFKIDSFL